MARCDFIPNSEQYYYHFSQAVYEKIEEPVLILSENKVFYKNRPLA